MSLNLLGNRSNLLSSINPLRTTVIQKLLEIVGIVRLCPSCSFATALDYRQGWSPEYVRKSMHACRSVSVACRPAEKRQRRGEIGSIHRSILVGHRRPNRPQGVNIIIQSYRGRNSTTAEEVSRFQCLFPNLNCLVCKGISPPKLAPILMGG